MPKIKCDICKKKFKSKFIRKTISSDKRYCPVCGEEIRDFDEKVKDAMERCGQPQNQ